MFKRTYYKLQNSMFWVVITHKAWISACSHCLCRVYPSVLLHFWCQISDSFYTLTDQYVILTKKLIFDSMRSIWCLHWTHCSSVVFSFTASHKNLKSTVLCPRWYSSTLASKATSVSDLAMIGQSSSPIESHIESLNHVTGSTTILETFSSCGQLL